MAGKRISRTDPEWLDLIMECRQSGLSDAQWCRNNRIPESTFYNAVCRLRKKACAIPASSVHDRPGKVLDLTSASQDVVPIRIEPDELPAAEIAPMRVTAAPHLDNSHRIEILSGSTCIRVSNGADPDLLASVLSVLGKLPC